MITEDTTEVKLNDLNVFLQTSMQQYFIQLAVKTGELAKSVNANVTDFGFSAGSSLASFIYEILSEEDTKCSDDIQNFEEIQKAFLENILKGYNEKLQILKDPSLLAETANLSHVEIVIKQNNNVQATSYS